ncbi:MAG: response regulator transcription factor [Chloroflexi bacterium]|nr:response regulator transcription factor [Chloroflexota bacterium]
MTQTVLIIEDEKRIAHWVQTYFERAGFETAVTHDGLTGLTLARETAPDLIILDLMLPKLNGMTICETLRQETAVPIIMLTARDKEQDRILGLETGADDYVVKPFSPNELVARARAVLRRVKGHQQQSITAGAITLDIEAHACTIHDRPIALSRTQFAILETLMRHQNQVLSREQLLELAFTDGLDVTDRTIDTHIRRLRRQIEADPKNPQRIKTVYGIGYKFVPC